MNLLTDQSNSFINLKELTQHLSSQRSDRRDPLEIFYLPLECPIGKKCPTNLCIFAHTKLETIFHPIIYRTKACQKYRNGTCEYESRCTFYHDSIEREKAEAAWSRWEQTWYGWRSHIHEIIKEKYSSVEGLSTKLESIMKIHKSAITSSLLYSTTPANNITTSPTPPNSASSFLNPTISYPSQAPLNYDTINIYQSKINQRKDVAETNFIKNPLNAIVGDHYNKHFLEEYSTSQNIKNLESNNNIDKFNKDMQILKSFVDMERLNYKLPKQSLNDQQDLTSFLNSNNIFSSTNHTPQPPGQNACSNLFHTNSPCDQMYLERAHSCSSTTPPTTVMNSFPSPLSSSSTSKTFKTRDMNSLPQVNLPMGLCNLPPTPTSESCDNYHQLYDTFLTVLNALNHHSQNCTCCNASKTITNNSFSSISSHCHLHPEYPLENHTNNYMDTIYNNNFKIERPLYKDNNYASSVEHYPYN